MKEKKEFKSKSKLKLKVQIKKPLQVNCFKCANLIEVKWNRSTSRYVERNNWYYWTEQEENKDKYICNSCLINLYKNDKWEYLENIANEKKRVILRSYISSRVLSFSK